MTTIAVAGVGLIVVAGVGSAAVFKVGELGAAKPVAIV